MVPTHRKIVTSKLTAEVELEIEEDRAERSDALEQSVVQLCSYIEAACQPDGPDLFEVTGRLWKLLMLVGLRAVELVCAMRRRAPTTTREHDHQGRCYHYYRQKEYTLRCVFGEGTMWGSQYVRGKNARSGDELCPQMAQLGLLSLGGGFGPRLALECAHMSSRCAFETAKEQLERFLGYVPSTRAMHGIVDRIGPVARRILEDAPCPEGDVLIVQLDGRGLRKIRQEEYEKRCQGHKKGDEARPRRRRNDSRYLDSKREAGHKKSKKREVTVGIIYALDRTGDDGWTMVDKHYVARLGDREATMAHLGDKLEGLDREPEQLIFLSDGAPQYADLCREHLPQATHVIDYYHVLEYIWGAAGALRGDDQLQHEAWIRLLKQFLCQGQPHLVVTMLEAELAKIPKRGPGNKGRRKALAAAIGYIDKRREMMPYDELLDEGLEIGSGAIESAVRQVVQMRFDGPGMRWGNERPDKMLDLVCTRLSGCWAQLEDRTRQRTSTPRKVRRITPLGVAEARQMEAAA